MPRTREEDRTYIPRQIRWQVLKDCGNKCAHCGTPLSFDKSTLEHVIPLHKGGRNETNNFVSLCKPCNKDKNDDIVEPRLYYPHLPKSKLKEVQATFQTYIKSIRWLDYTTVFMTDRFDLGYRRFLPPNKATGRRLDIPATCHVRKLRPPETIELLLPYAARLCAEDKTLIPLQEKDITSPFYGIFNGDTVMALIQPYIELLTVDTPVHHTGEKRPILFIDFLPAYHDDIRLHNCQNYASVLVSLLCEVQKTLRTLPDDAGVEMLLRVPRSDKMGSALLETLHRVESEHYVLFFQHFGDDPDTCASILCADAILCQHDLKVINPDNVMATDWEKFQHSLTAAGKELKDLQKPVKSELALAPEPKPKAKPLTKSQKKRKYKKTNYKRRH